MSQHVITMACHLRDFTRMNPLRFLGSKEGEEPQEFLGEVYKILFSMGDFNLEVPVGGLSTEIYVPNLVHTMEGHHGSKRWSRYLGDLQEEFPL